MRDKKQRTLDGRYAHELNAMCQCGRRRGDHMAVPPHDLDETNCNGFRAVTRSSTSRIRDAASDPVGLRLVCCYCSGKPSRGGLDIDGDYAHKNCHMEACR